MKPSCRVYEGMKGAARGLGLFGALGVVACGVIGWALACQARSAEPPPIDPKAVRLLRSGPLVGHAGHEAVWIWAEPAEGTRELEVAVSLATVGDPFRVQWA